MLCNSELKMKKKYLAFIVLIVAVVVLVFSRWNAWFANPEEEVYITPSYPDRIILLPGENTSLERVVSWRCDSLLQNGYVELWADDGDTLRVEAKDTLIQSRSGKSAFYHATLRSLKCDVQYHYRVVTGLAVSSVYDFSVRNAKEQLSFIMLGDIQDSLNGNTGAVFKNIYRRFPDIHFWAVNGDVIERPMDSYWNYWFASMDSITQTVPIVAATGNHEYLKGLVKKLDSRWTSTFYNPENGPEGFERRTYLLEFDNLLMFVIDTDGLQTPADYLRVRNWLSDKLKHADAKWKIVMMHHPVYSVRSGRDNLFIRWTFKPVFEQYKVDLVLEGHDHGYSRIITKNNSRNLSVPVYITTNCSPKQYPIGFDKIHDRLGTDLNFYQYISVSRDSLLLKVYTTEHAIYDDLLFVKNGSEHVSITDKAVDIPEILDLPAPYRGWKKERLDAYEKEKKERLTEKKSRHL